MNRHLSEVCLWNLYILFRRIWRNYNSTRQAWYIHNDRCLLLPKPVEWYTNFLCDAVFACLLRVALLGRKIFRRLRAAAKLCLRVKAPASKLIRCVQVEKNKGARCWRKAQVYIEYCYHQNTWWTHNFIEMNLYYDDFKFYNYYRPVPEIRFSFK